MIEKRKLGTLEVSPLCLGGNVFAWTADEATSFKLLDAFIAAGFNSLTPPTVTPPGRPATQAGNRKP
jgi:hypothetical protein